MSREVDTCTDCAALPGTARRSGEVVWCEKREMNTSAAERACVLFWHKDGRRLTVDMTNPKWKKKR